MAHGGSSPLWYLPVGYQLSPGSKASSTGEKSPTIPGVQYQEFRKRHADTCSPGSNSVSQSLELHCSDLREGNEHASADDEAAGPSAHVQSTQKQAAAAAAAIGPSSAASSPRATSYGQRHTNQQLQRALAAAAAAAASSPRRSSQAAKELSSSDMDEILGVMDALGACRKDYVPAVSAPAAANEQQDSPAAAAVAADNSSQQKQQKQQPEQQQTKQEQVQEQQSPAASPRGSTPRGRPTRASMLSSKVLAGKGPVVPVKPAVFSFDAAHPGLADKHYLRTKEQDRCGSGSWQIRHCWSLYWACCLLQLADEHCI